MKPIPQNVPPDLAERLARIELQICFEKFGEVWCPRCMSKNVVLRKRYELRAWGKTPVEMRLYYCKDCGRFFRVGKSMRRR